MECAAWGAGKGLGRGSEQRAAAGGYLRRAPVRCARPTSDSAEPSGGASVRPEREGVEDWRRGTFGSGLSYFQQNFGTKLRHGSGVS